MIKTKTQIKQDIVNHLKSCESNTRRWYVGIAKNPKERLFSDHDVSRKNGCWIYREARNHRTARIIEAEIINKYGTKGANGGGGLQTKYVYAYRINSTTTEQ